MALAFSMSSPTRDSEWATAGPLRRSIAVSGVEVTQPSNIVGVRSANAKVSLVDSLMRLYLSLALCISHRIRANEPQRQKLPNDLANDCDDSLHALRLE